MQIISVGDIMYIYCIVTAITLCPPMQNDNMGKLSTTHIDLQKVNLFSNY